MLREACEEIPFTHYDSYKTLCEMYPNTEFFSGPYFSTFGLNTDQKKLRIWTLFTKWEVQFFSVDEDNNARLFL